MKKTATLLFLMLAIVLSSPQIDPIQWVNDAVSPHHVNPEAEQKKSRIYKWVDKNGVFHFSNSRPESEKRVEVVNTEDYRVETLKLGGNLSSVTKKSTQQAPKKPLKKKRKKVAKTGSKSKYKVVIYTTSWCGYCKQAAAFLRSRNISFKEYDIGKDKKARAKMRAAGGGGGVPFAIINGRKIRGFSREAYKRALGLR